MTAYALLKALHILLIVTWLGADIGVFTSSFWVANSRYSIETRLQMGRLGGMLDMGPRSSLILTFAVGVLLTLMGGWGLRQLGGAAPIAVGALVLLCAVWLWAVWQQYFAVRELAAGRPVAGRAFFVGGFRRLDLYLRVALAIALIAMGILGIAGNGLVQATWLNWKLGLFGLIVLSGVAIRLLADEFPVALGEIVRLGSTPEREQRLSRALNRARPVVLGLWGLIVVIVVVAVAKPS